ncbi:GDP-L-fucose synthase [Paenibacillus mesophilus]|uniref:GDP-L-fucose synthase family protein n=1 Tax=Paenibacillus mesophilus TaxID=2582849 RepID=UPI00110DFBE5|nr:GDP-L-fucose synthase [Paenibacillus mesophilus]TMV53047.1 GDP-L-fucose synthase [Paenibacillus mesophilus]
MELADKSIVVTGGAGFLGKHVVNELRRLGCERVHVPRSKQYDLRQEQHIVRMLDDFRPDVVFHLAAVVGGIGANEKNPGSFFYDNLVMGAHLIEHSRRKGIRKMVAIGTICSYPKFAPVPFSEADLWNGYPEETNAPYGLAKKMMLVQSQAYRKQYGFNSIFLLPVNLYGPGDNFDLETSHVIPAIIRKCEEAKRRGEPSITLWGDGTPTREFLYAEDAAEGIVRAAALYDGSDPVNLGSGQEIRIRELAETIRELVGYEGEIVWDTGRPNGQPRRKLDVRLAKERFGFEARTDMRTGLERTIQWYKEEYS